jgi:hypothetical protein
MLPFLVTIGIIGVLIVCGVRVSLYLYKQGVFSRRRFRRSRRNQVLVKEEETEGEEESETEPYIPTAGEDAETSRYARRGLWIFLGGLTVVVLLISTLASVVMHK